MSFEPIDIEFLINSPEVQAASDKVKKNLISIGYTSEEAAKKINSKLNNALTNQALKTLPLLEKQGAKTTRVWNGLGNSINQISREMPAFAVSAQTGFLAISNNIPILVDEIERLKLKNDDLVASGKKGIPVWKQVVKGLFSWQSALSLGVSLLTIYGADIVKWIEKLIKGKNAVKELTAAEKDLQKEKKKLIKTITEEYGALALLVSRISKTNITQEQRVNLLKELNEKYPFFIKQVDKESVSNIELSKRLKEVNALYIARIALQLQQKEIELAFNSVAEKKLKLGKEQIVTEEQLANLATIINKDRNTEGRLKQIDLENKSYEEQIKLIKQALESEVNYFATSSAKGGENEKAYTARLNNRQKQLALIREYELVVGRTDFGLDNETEKLKKQQEILKKLEGKYKITIEEINELFSSSDKDEKGVTEKANKYQSLMDKLTAIDKEYSRKSFTKDQEELQALTDKFSKIRTLIERFNADPKNKAQIIDLTAFNNLETQATADVTFRQETSKLKTQLDEAKELYKEYEEYKATFGAAAAKKEYAGKINEAANYYEYLRNQARKNKESAIAVNDGTATGGQIERINLINKNLNAATKEQQEIFKKQLADLLTYHQQRKVLIENYNKKLVELTLTNNVNAITVLNEKHNAELTALDDVNIKKLSSYKELQKGILDLSKKEALLVIKNAKELLNDKTLNISDKLQEKIKGAITDLEKSINSSSLDKIDLYTQHLGAFGDALQELGGVLVSSVVSNAGELLSGVAGGLDEIFVAFDKNATDAQKINAGISSAISLISVFTGAAAKRKAAEEEYYLNVIGFQNDYNLALAEQKRLQAELAENVFTTDYLGRVSSGIEGVNAANNGLQDAINELTEKGETITGQRNAVSWGNVGTATASGAGLGAAIGSVVPVIGTIIGGAVGAVAGFIGGLFGGKKKKDTMTAILTEFPELIKQSSDGLKEVDVKMAEFLIANNLVKGETKEILETIIEWNKQLEESKAQLNNVLGELVGRLGDDLKTALVDAFVAGEDAGVNMMKSIEDSLENLLSSLIFNQIFNDSLTKLQSEMLESFGIDGNGDKSFSDDFSRFFNEISPLTEQFNKAIQDAQKEAEKLGISIFDGSETNETGLVAATRQSMTEDTANELTGLWRGSYDLTKKHYQVVEEYLSKKDTNISVFSAMLLSMEATKINTHLTVEELKKINTKLVEIQSSKKDANSRDLGI